MQDKCRTGAFVRALLVCGPTIALGLLQWLCMGVKGGRICSDIDIGFVGMAFLGWLTVALLPPFLFLFGRWRATAVAYAIAMSCLCAYLLLDICTWMPPGEGDFGLLEFPFSPEHAYDNEDNGHVLTFAAFRKSVESVREDKRIKGALDDMLMAIVDRTGGVNSLQVRLNDKDPLKTMTEPLRHLRLKDGWTLDCALDGDSHMANSKLMQRKDDESADAEFVLDGTPESAWERYLLDFLGERLVLYWHAHYGSRYIITSALRFRVECNWMAGAPEVWNAFSPWRRLRLLCTDLRPAVKVTGDNAEVSYCLFQPWRGLYRCFLNVNLKTGEICGAGKKPQKLAHYESSVMF